MKNLFQEIQDLIYRSMRSLCFHIIIWILREKYWEIKYRILQSTFKIYISNENMEKLRNRYPEIYEIFSEECKLNKLFFYEFDIYHLIWEKQKEKEITEKYDLLYIGKSNAEKSDFDILNRLSSHKTIQKITRDMNQEYRSKELMLMIFSFKSKLYRGYGVPQYFTNIVMGDSKWEQAKLLVNIKENQEMILLIEAILINHFKPKYNQQYVNRIATESKIYHQFDWQDVNPVTVELDMSVAGGWVKLKTKEIETETKMREINCLKKEDAIEIRYNDMPNLLYDIL